MTNVSKKKLPAKEFEKLYNQLNAIIAGLDKKSSGEFFSDLLGPEEKIMLVKRLAAVVMYMEGNSSYRVWTLLHISPSTAEKIRFDYENGRYYNVQRLVTKKRKDYEEFWETLEVILRLGMPPMGRGRWKSVFKRM